VPWLHHRFLAAASLVAVLALVSASAASAKIYLRGLDGRTVHSGQVVGVYVPGCSGNPTCERMMKGMRISITPAVRRVWGKGVDPRPRWYVGKLNGKGGLTFRVPQIPKGRYWLIAWAPPPIFGTGQFVNVTNRFTIAS
jgi:hypothetical protein